MNEQIENNFMEHDLKEGQLNYTVIRNRAKELAYIINEYTAE